MTIDDLLFSIQNVSPQCRGTTWENWIVARDSVIAFLTGESR